MGTFVSEAAVAWAGKQFKKLPKDQTLLIFLLIISNVPVLEGNGRFANKSFENEFQKYFGIPYKGSTRYFGLFDNAIRAENYFSSTVIGRLLNGSHHWTREFITRTPEHGTWPARFALRDNLIPTLKLRDKAPFLDFGMRLPLLATAIVYFKNVDLTSHKVQNEDDLVNLYQQEVISKDPKLAELFEIDVELYWGDLFAHERIGDVALFDCLTGEEALKSIKIYESDLEILQTRISADESVAEAIRKIIRGTK